MGGEIGTGLIAVRARGGLVVAGRNLQRARKNDGMRAGRARPSGIGKSPRRITGKKGYGGPKKKGGRDRNTKQQRRPVSLLRGLIARNKERDQDREKEREREMQKESQKNREREREREGDPKGGLSK